MELPQTTGDCRNLIFAVIGASLVGKSHYIAVLINELQKRVGPALGILLEPVNDRTIRRYREYFYDPVYRRGEVIVRTVTAIADNRVQFPLMYSLSFHGRGFLDTQKIRKTVTLAFYDTAGEDLDDQDIMSTVNKYIYRADGIILILDPLQLGVVRDQLDGRTPLPERRTETLDIITRTTNLILAGRRLKPSARVPTPLAIAFSKFDAVESLVDPQFQLRASPNHIAGFDKADAAAVNGEMQSLLSQWDGDDILHQVRLRYPRHAFFGMTALGCNPHGTNRIPHVLPRRVEDPFLWLLHHHGLIKAASR
jgi:GTPase SAR1 family protein